MSNLKEKITIIKLRPMSGGPWLIFSLDENLQGLLEEIRLFADECDDNFISEGLEVTFGRITLQELNNLPEHPGW